MKKIQQQWGVLLAVLTAGLLSGCGMMGVAPEDTSDSAVTAPLKVELPKTEVPKTIARSNGTSSKVKVSDKCGNEPTYTVNGRSYQVLASSSGYSEEGLASRYGAEYQGTQTAGCEKFDMQSFTAAHRTLPLPSFVRVTNLANSKKVIVKVNDRGPFDNDGLIRLSSAAASTLGVAAKGRARVRIESVGLGSAGKKTQQPVPGFQKAPAPVKRPLATSQRRMKRLSMKQPTPMQLAAIKSARASGKSFYVVVNNYQSQPAALDMFVRLTSVGLDKTELASAVNKGRKVHQVRIGPLYTQDQIDSVKDTLSSNGLATFKVVEVDE